MIYRNGKLILEVQNNFSELIEQVEQRVQRKIGAIHKGAQLVWLTVYNEVFGCFGGGTWLQDRLWKTDELWKNT